MELEAEQLINYIESLSTEYFKLKCRYYFDGVEPSINLEIHCNNTLILKEKTSVTLPLIFDNDFNKFLFDVKKELSLKTLNYIINYGIAKLYELKKNNGE